MKAAVREKSGTLKVENIPIPSLNSDEVLLRIRACGVCGSDLRYFEGEDVWALHTRGIVKEVPPNVILGHEFSGEVVKVGDSSLEKWLGKRVTAVAQRPCWSCHYCRKGQDNVCFNWIHLGHGTGWGKREYYPGAMAEYCAVWANNLFEIPENVSFEEAALTDVVAVSLRAINNSNISLGETVAILGSGAAGCTLAQTACLRGASQVFCTDILPGPLEIAKKVGADEIINRTNVGAVQYIKEKTRGEGVDIVFDCVGEPDIQIEGLDMLKRKGRFITLAVMDQQMSFPLTKISAERSIRTSCSFTFIEFEAALNLMSEGRIKVKPLITHRFPLDKTKHAFEVAFDKEKYNSSRVMIIP